MQSIPISDHFPDFLGKRFYLEMALEKTENIWIFKASSRVVSGDNIKPKTRKNDREWVYTRAYDF